MKIPLLYIPKTRYKYFLVIKKKYKSEKYIIPIGKDCHPAHSLDVLQIRNQSLPYDWIRLKAILGLQIVSSNIKERFKYFLHDLKKNQEGNTYSKKYPNAEFTHAKDVFDNLELRKTFEKRAQRLLNIIDHQAVSYLYILEIDYFNNSEDIDFFYNTIIAFKEVLKPQDSLHIYIRFDELSDVKSDTSTSLLHKIEPLKQVFAATYVREKEKYGIWGNEKAYPKLYKSLNLKIKQVFPDISIK